MRRRTFLRTGFVFSAAGLSGLELRPALGFPAPQPTAAGRDDVLRLNSNENPLGLAPAARRAILDGLGEANRYPRAARVQMVEALASRHGVRPENIVLGNGSTEVLQMAVQALAMPGARLVLAQPTFEDVPWYCEPFSYRLQPVPIDARFAHDIGRMRQTAESDSSRVLVYVCNPNNPTGTLTPSAELDAWIESAAGDTWFLVDEAYYEYCEDSSYWSCARWIADRRNVIVARSFSKIYGMAGMRLGYAVARTDTAERIARFIGKNNANQLALVAGLASLNDAELIPRSRRANAEGISILRECLDELGLEHLPSHTNFVMHRIPGDLDLYRKRMEEHGARVGRPFPPMLDYNRVSIGSVEDMARFTGILRDFRRRGWV